MRKLAVILLALAVACGGQQKQEEAKTEEPQESKKLMMEEEVEYARTEAGNPIVILETTMGEIEVEVYEKDSPIHAPNFLKLVEADYYDNNVFHRVIEDFMVQTGDPTGTGGGGPGYTLEMEPLVHKNIRGNMAMAQSAQGVNGSQFYILVSDQPHLDNPTPPANQPFPCFAGVINGMDVVDKISEVETDANNRPVEDVRIIEARPKPAEETMAESHEGEGH